MKCQVNQAVPQAEQDAGSGQVCCGVIPEELRIAEQKAGLLAMVQVPAREWQDGDKQRDQSRPRGTRAARLRPWVEFGAALRDDAGQLPAGQRQRSHDGGLFRQRRERKQGGDADVGRWCRPVSVAFKVEGQRPHGERGGKQVGMGQAGLREPDGVQRGQQGDQRGHRIAGERAHQPEHSQQRRGRYHTEKCTGIADGHAGQVPPAGEQQARQRRVRVGQGGMRN